MRLRGRSPQHAGWGRGALFLAGTAVALGAVVSPLDRVAARELLSAHMLQHLLLGDVAPLLLVLGVRGPLALFLLPPAALRRLARARPLRAALSLVLRPRVSLALWCLAIGAWHVPAAYDAAAAHPALHVVEHASFLAAGLLLWTQVLDPARTGRLSAGGRAAFAAAVIVAGAVLSEVLLASGPLYPRYAAVAERPFGLTAADDQAKAALLMMAEQIATLGVAAALLLWTHVERVARETRAARGPA